MDEGQDEESLSERVELRGLEPLTPALPGRQIRGVPEEGFRDTRSVLRATSGTLPQ
jgi:hypothetical protein